MTKGKYATRAARRREDQDVQSEISACQRDVARLTAEVAELTGALDAERAGRKDTTRRLAAQLDEQVTPELAATREELERQRRRAADAEAAQRKAQQNHDRHFTTILGLLAQLTGLTRAEAFELALTIDPEFSADNLTEDQRVTIDWDDTGRSGRLSSDQRAALQVARGIRHRTPYTERVADLLDAAEASRAGAGPS
jgi:hypothetical protein